MTLDGDLLKDVETIAREGGRTVRDVYSRHFSILEKADKSPLTEADAAAHLIIVERLTMLTPSLPILSEESVEEFHGPDSGGCYWLVDPLDGTKEFIKRNGEFTVNIALIARGRPVLGVVYAPALGVLYSAASGLGAFKQRADGMHEPIWAAEHNTGTPWRVVSSRSHTDNSLPVFLQRLGAHELMSIGSSLKLCLIAEGRADLYPRLGPTSLWDTGAAQCIVELAGGGVVKLTGEPLTYDNPFAILNPFFVAHGRSTENWSEMLADEGVTT